VPERTSPLRNSPHSHQQLLDHWCRLYVSIKMRYCPWPFPNQRQRRQAVERLALQWEVRDPVCGETLLHFLGIEGWEMGCFGIWVMEILFEAELEVLTDLPQKLHQKRSSCRVIMQPGCRSRGIKEPKGMSCNSFGNPRELSLHRAPPMSNKSAE